MSSYNVQSLEGKLILTATILASGMAFLDGTVVNIAIPAIQKTFGASLVQIEWMVNGYMLMLASVILIGGSLGDRYGRKKIFLYGIGLFVISSVLCGVSHSINQLIAFRVLQGIGASLMIPGSLSIIDISFESSVRGRVIGLWSGFAAGVAALGPFMGGWLVQTLGWQSIFYINIPIGILAFFLALKYVPESKNEESRSLDILGTLLIFFSFLGISFGLIEAPNFGWSSPAVYASVGIGFLFFLQFIFTERKAKEPLVPGEIFQSSLVKGANIATFFLYFALSGLIFFLVLNFQQIQHYSPIIAGVSLLPTVLLITFLSGSGGSLSDKYGPRLPMIVGPLIVSLGMALLLFSGIGGNYFLSYLPSQLLVGLGMSLVIAPLTKSALSVKPAFSGKASGINNAVSRFAGLLAVALLGSVVLFLFSSQLSRTITSSSLAPSQKVQILQQKNKLGGIEIPNSFDIRSKIVTRNAIEESFLYSFRYAVVIITVFALMSSIVAFFTITAIPETSSK